PSVPYAGVLVLAASVLFGIIYKVREGLSHAWWYLAYILFLTGMTYIGGVGAKSLVNVDWGSVLVIAVSIAVFLPWGVASRMEEVMPPALSQQSLET
ncbi:MAG: APC family permease, partial [Firmicutes bacterium]|nr:APC family permease [Bacillota bacterium]